VAVVAAFEASEAFHGPSADKLGLWLSSLHPSHHLRCWGFVSKIH